MALVNNTSLCLALSASYILTKHQKPLFKLFRSLVNAQTRDNFDRAVEKLMDDELASQYPGYQRHIHNNYLNHPEMRAMFSRHERDLPTNALTTITNFFESTSQNEKRHRPWSLVQLGSLNHLINIDCDLAVKYLL